MKEENTCEWFFQIVFLDLSLVYIKDKGEVRIIFVRTICQINFFSLCNQSHIITFIYLSSDIYMFVGIWQAPVVFVSTFFVEQEKVTKSYSHYNFRRKK